MIALSPSKFIRSLSAFSRGSALVIVLSMAAIMTGLVITVFVLVSGERRSADARLKGVSSEQLAASAPQMVMSQIRDAATSTATGHAWASQPGMVRTFDVTGAPAGVYKLYSAGRMFAAGSDFSENEDVPPADWNAGRNSALFCDINQPVKTSSNGLVYPVADPGPAATSFAKSGAIPGYQRAAAATPGFDPDSAVSPTNNPMPMPVRWLYILKNGEFAVPESVAADGKVVFAAGGNQPAKDNPVIGRLAFWGDDDTSKININTAGYAKNDTGYWTYWDTPVANTQDENNWLSWAQPWTNEYQRYPGHPASTGLNVVFDSLNLSDSQILSLTPSFAAGGTIGGTVRVKTPPTADQIAELRKDERLFPTVDEMFYNPKRGANAAGIPREELEARRFLLTANSRAPETTLFNTPRITIWPTWQTESKRTSLDGLIAFCSTLAGQPFYFVRESKLATNELDIPQNLAIWNYMRALSAQPIPGFGGDFGTKYGTHDRDQILTSIFDAVRLANLDDRSAPPAESTAGWSFTAGALENSGGTWAPPKSTVFTEGYIAPTDGPNNTRGAGRASTLAEVAILFARTNESTVADEKGIREIDKVKAAVLYGFFTPAAGFVQPGQNRRIRVTGLTSFKVRASGTAPEQQVFANDVFDHTEIDSVACRRELGGRIEWTASQMFNPPGTTSPIGPPTGNVVLPYDPNNLATFLLSGTKEIEGKTVDTGATINIEVYSPATASTPYQSYQITFPATVALSPMLVSDASAIRAWTSKGRWMQGTDPYLDLSEGRISFAGDTVLAMQNNTGDYRSEILRTGWITDFKPHVRYGKTDLLPYTMNSKGNAYHLSRRASSLKWAGTNDSGVPNEGTNPELYEILFGSLLPNFTPGYTFVGAPVIPSYLSGGIQGDFSNGPGIAGEGSLSPKTDEGGAVVQAADDDSPYFRNVNQGIRLIAQPTFNSPNRQMPSAVYFGSIPTGAPWQTLLFRPARSFHSGGTGHKGAESPPDFLMLDWFHMPVVEPYAISEPFSTAGKINLNSQLMPFGSYIRRETALHAVLRSARIVAIPDSLVGQIAYTANSAVSKSPDTPTRYPIDENKTLDLLRARFDGKNVDGSGQADPTGRRVFLTNAEICSVDLVPQGSSNLSSFWADKRTTGDNTREAPYSSLLPRLTAKSNTFTVHVTAQALQTAEPDGGWREGKGGFGAEWRGSYGVERYIDSNDARLAGSSAPAFLTGAVSVEPYYKFRMFGARRFNP